MEDPSDSVPAVFRWLTHIQRIDQIGQWKKTAVVRNGVGGSEWTIGAYGEAPPYMWFKQKTSLPPGDQRQWVQL